MSYWEVLKTNLIMTGNIIAVALCIFVPLISILGIGLWVAKYSLLLGLGVSVTITFMLFVTIDWWVENH